MSIQVHFSFFFLLTFHNASYTDAPQLTMGLLPDKPTVTSKSQQSKRHLIQLTYQTSKLSLAELKYAQNTLSKQNKTKNGGNTVHGRVSGIYPCDSVSEGKRCSLLLFSIMREYLNAYC